MRAVAVALLSYPVSWFVPPIVDVLGFWWTQALVILPAAIVLTRIANKEAR